ncbi:histidine kinase/DNA gyrase B/HSP90-like ATPase [Roseimicrobium gellanilyticum]|uniref:Histidine kinase/DNA gyrase B/HSP90-like ATPase n=1 Tax=Roseimicrobium gellanilyticum TaxID=748857 RepID=A0A366HR41_9BACT|nr:sensor histidine kinase [Roseimicrobium gellanilyticum]RBP46130.1 histidine kinase/DNA gyrase B/HSP90-like ATPase [Roseimicrobium gellanilyticum]
MPLSSPDCPQAHRRCASLHRALLAGVVAVAVLFAQQAAAQTLTTARDIAAHVTPKDGDPAAVSLDAVVTFLDPGNTIFLQDDTGVTFIRAAKSNPRPAIGTRLRVSGVTHNGLIIGGIKPETIEFLGRYEPPPAPKEITQDDLASGRYHYHYVTLSGVGRSLHRVGENAFTLRLLTGAKVVEVRFDEVPTELPPWVDAELRIRGLAAGDINDRRELVAPYIRVRSIDDVELIKSAPPEAFESPPIPLPELQRAISRAHRVKVQGVALSAPLAGGLFLRQGDESVFVQTDDTGIKAGDVVEALGFPEMGVFSAHLTEAECRVVGTEAVPAPTPENPGGLQDGRDAELITLEVQVAQRTDRDHTTELVTQTGPVSINVTSPTLLPREVQSGALLRLTGLARVTATRSDGYRAKPTAYRLWLRDARDVVILQSTPWWNSERIGLAFGGAMTLALLALIWIALLRRQVSRQLTVIEAKAQREAIMEERQRIAREFHDTLEQELAGLSLRLDAALPRVADAKAHDLLDQQRRLLGRLQTDTRDFVWDLRDASRQDAPLDASLRSLVEHLQVNTTVPLKFESDVTDLKVPPLVQHHLLRITREAVNNALKYAQARSVRVQLSRDEAVETLALTISDDGKGFDLTAAQAMDGHFGIRGMQERARKISAELEVSSRPGEGASVRVNVNGV